MSEDLIRRRDAIAEIRKARTTDVASYQYAELFINAVCRAPSADRPQGEWIAKTENYHSHWVCSECGSWALLEYNEQMCLSKYCPSCGAIMTNADNALNALDVAEVEQ